MAYVDFPLQFDGKGRTRTTRKKGPAGTAPKKRTKASSRTTTGKKAKVTRKTVVGGKARTRTGRRTSPAGKPQAPATILPSKDRSLTELKLVSAPSPRPRKPIEVRPSKARLMMPPSES